MSYKVTQQDSTEKDFLMAKMKLGNLPSLMHQRVARGMQEVLSSKRYVDRTPNGGISDSSGTTVTSAADPVEVVASMPKHYATFLQDGGWHDFEEIMDGVAVSLHAELNVIFNG